MIPKNKKIEKEVGNESVEMDAVILGLAELQKTLEAYFVKDNDDKENVELDALIVEMGKMNTLLEKNQLPFFEKFDEYIKGEKKEKEEMKKLFGTLTDTLSGILEESKKKEQYEYEVEIDDSLRKKLKGDDGKTPIKGEDYFTSQEVQEITDSIAKSLGSESRGLIERTIKESLSTLDVARRLASLEKEKKISFKSLTDLPDYEARIDDIYKHLERVHVGGATSIFGLTDVDFTGTVIGQTYSVLRTKDGIGFIVGGGGGVTDHGALTGLADDDHTQYHNDTRGDARYYTKALLDGGQLNTLYYTIAQVNSLLSGKENTGVAAGLVTAHEGAADPHTQYQKESEKGVANGYAELDGTGKVPAAQLPSYVDDVLEFANIGAFPGTGTTGIIYVALDTNKTYRWTGTVYVEISASNIVNGGIHFNLFRSSGLQVGDGFKVVVPFSGTIIGWVVATKDGTSGTVGLSVKKAAYAGVPSFSAIDGTEKITLTGASKNQDANLTTWTTAIASEDHFDISVDSVSGVVTGVYGIIKVSKSS